MIATLEQMLKNYNLSTMSEKKNAMKEIMQEIVLCGLSRAGFFKEAAFYGETALRIFHGLDRFSEDLDFSLCTSNPNFDLASFFPLLQNEVSSYSLNVEIQQKEKTNDSAIKSAFLKGNTREHLIIFYSDSKLANSVANNEIVKIKFEVDTNPPLGATYEYKYRMLPVPYSVKLYDMPSLFAGKIHAVLCRGWHNRVKGRDLYDYVFYLSKGIAVNLLHLRERLIQTNFIDANTSCSLSDIKEALCKRFEEIDYDRAKEDVAPFITNAKFLDVWSLDFFKDITSTLKETPNTIVL